MNFHRYLNIYHSYSQIQHISNVVKIMEKAIMDLAKGAGKVDRKHAKTILGLWKYTSNNIKKFKELIGKEVLSKLQ